MASRLQAEREFFDPAPLPWRPAPGFPGGVWEQVISGGGDEDKSGGASGDK